MLFSDNQLFLPEEEKMKVIMLENKNFSDLTFDQALKLAKYNNAELVVMVKPPPAFKGDKRRTQCWVLSNTKSGEEFYNDHKDKSNAWIAILPHWFLEQIVGMPH